MNHLLLSISVLWLGVQWCSGHSLSKIKVKNLTELVYKVHEDKDGKTLTISTPNLEKPYLREIIYYHIIEKPFRENKDSYAEPSPDEVPDFDESRRSFTNGQGYQFLPVDDDDPDKPVDEDVKLDVGNQGDAGNDKEDATEAAAEVPADKDAEDVPNKRGKREEQYNRHIPRPPKLSRLNLKRLPKYIQKLLSSTTLPPKSNLNSPHHSIHVGNSNWNEDDSESNSSPDSDSNGSNSELNDSNSDSNDSISSGSSQESIENSSSSREDSQGSKETIDVGSNSDENLSHSNGNSSGEGDVSDFESSGSGQDSSGSDENSTKSSGNSSGSGESHSGSDDSHSGSGESHSGSDDSHSGSEESHSGSGENHSGSEESHSGSGESHSRSRESNSGSGESGSLEEYDNSGENGDKNKTDEATDDLSEKFDQILTDLHDIFVKGNATIVVPLNSENKDRNFNVLDMLNNVFSHIKNKTGTLTNAVIVHKGDPKTGNVVNILEGLFTNIVNNNIVINNNVPVGSNRPDEINAEKDKVPTTEKSNIVQEISSTTNSNIGHSESTDNSDEEVTTQGPKDNTGGDSSLHKNPAETIPGENEPHKEEEDSQNPKEESTPPTQIGSEATQEGGNLVGVIENPDDIRPDEIVPYESGESWNPNEDLTPSSIDSNESIDLNKGDRPYETDNDETLGETKRPIKKEDNTERPKDVTESSKEEPKTECPVEIKEVNNPEGGMNKQLDYMLELMNNEKFWAFMGNLGAKYLESLTERTTKFIKDEVAAQIDKYFEVHKQDFIKELELNTKEKNPEVRPQQENGNGNNNDASDEHNISDSAENSIPSNKKNINESTNVINTEKTEIDSVNESKNETLKDNISVHVEARTVYGNTVGNDKVTNVYIFYANDNIGDIMKNIQHLVNGDNNTNIFTFSTHRPDPGYVFNENKDTTFKKPDLNEPTNTPSVEGITEQSQTNNNDVTEETNIGSERTTEENDVTVPTVDEPVTNGSDEVNDHPNTEHSTGPNLNGDDNTNSPVIEEPIPNHHDASQENSSDISKSSTPENEETTKLSDEVTEAVDTSYVVTESNVDILPETVADNGEVPVIEPVTEIVTEDGFTENVNNEMTTIDSNKPNLSENSLEKGESSGEKSSENKESPLEHNSSSAEKNSVSGEKSGEKQDATGEKSGERPTEANAVTVPTVDEPVTNGSDEVNDHPNTEHSTGPNLNGDDNTNSPAIEEPIPNPHDASQENSSDTSKSSTPENEETTEPSDVVTEAVGTSSVTTESNVDILPEVVEITTDNHETVADNGEVPVIEPVTEIVTEDGFTENGNNEMTTIDSNIPNASENSLEKGESSGGKSSENKEATLEHNSSSVETNNASGEKSGEKQDASGEKSTEKVLASKEKSGENKNTSVESTAEKREGSRENSGENTDGSGEKSAKKEDVYKEKSGEKTDGSGEKVDA